MSSVVRPLAERRATYAGLLCRHLARADDVSLFTGMQGNLGDHLIWVGTEHVLAAHGIHAERVDAADLDGTRRTGCLLVPGSGAFSHLFHEWLPDTIVRAAAMFDEVVIAPSAFDPEVAEVRRALECPNVVAIARDPFSYRSITRFGRANLALDLALHHPAFDPTLAPKQTTDGADVLVSMRTDQGSLLPQHGLAVHPTTNRDIALAAEDLDDYIAAVRSSAYVVTDRLHVVVTALMTGTPVTYVDPYDHKISRYLDFTFGDAAKRLATAATYEWLRDSGHVVEEGVA